MNLSYALSLLASCTSTLPKETGSAPMLLQRGWGRQAGSMPRNTRGRYINIYIYIYMDWKGAPFKEVHYKTRIINSQNKMCVLVQTALLVAVTANQPDIVQDLLSLGADINACDVKGQTALHLAAHYGLPVVLQVRRDWFSLVSPTTAGQRSWYWAGP